MDEVLTLPVELAPALRERALALLEQVSLTRVPVVPRTRRARPENRCVVCHQAGVLGGHHGADGRIEWGLHTAIRDHRMERSATNVAPLFSEEPHNGGPVAGWMLGHRIAHGRTDFPGDPRPDGHLGSARDLAYWGGLMAETDHEWEAE